MHGRARPRLARGLPRRVGWVPFEPTPGRGDPDAEATPASPGAGHRPHPDRHATTTTDHGARPTAPHAPRGRSPATRVPTRHRSGRRARAGLDDSSAARRAGVVGAVALLAAVLGLVAGLAAVPAGAGPAPSPAADAVEPIGRHGASTRGHERPGPGSVAHRGYRPRPAETHAEFARRRQVPLGALDGRSPSSAPAGRRTAAWDPVGRHRRRGRSGRARCATSSATEARAHADARRAAIRRRLLVAGRPSTRRRPGLTAGRQVPEGPSDSVVATEAVHACAAGWHRGSRGARRPGWTGVICSMPARPSLRRLRSNQRAEASMTRKPPKANEEGGGGGQGDHEDDDADDERRRRPTSSGGGSGRRRVVADLAGQVRDRSRRTAARSRWRIRCSSSESGTVADPFVAPPGGPSRHGISLAQRPRDQQRVPSMTSEPFSRRAVQVAGIPSASGPHCWSPAALDPEPVGAGQRGRADRPRRRTGPGWRRRRGFGVVPRPRPRRRRRGSAGGCRPSASPLTLTPSSRTPGAGSTPVEQRPGGPRRWSRPESVGAGQRWPSG